MSESDQEWIVAAGDEGIRLDKFLASPARIGSRARVAAALARGKVFINDVEAAPRDGAGRLTKGDVVRVWMDRPGTSKRRPGPFKSAELHILYEDDDLIVLNKPAGLLSVPLERKAEAVSVYDQIERHLRSHGKRKPLVVHRIDRDTSGIVVFAKRARAQEQLKSQFERREPERVYWAIVYGAPKPGAGTWRDHLLWDQKTLIQKPTHASDRHGREAISEYRVLETFPRMRGSTRETPETSLVEIRLHTGKRNQIRIQARLHGHPLVGERRYVLDSERIQDIPFQRQALHAHRLVIRHPVDGKRLELEAPLPADFANLLTELRRRSP